MALVGFVVWRLARLVIFPRSTFAVGRRWPCSAEPQSIAHMATKKVILYAQLYPGWQNSLFAPSLHQVPGGSFPGSVQVAVEVELPIVDPDGGTVTGRVVETSEPIPFPRGRAS